MAFRLLAIAFGLLLVCLVEFCLRLTDFGRPEFRDDPFIGFSEVRPLFVLDESSHRYRIPDSRHDFFRPEGFAARKQPNEYRIFCLGGSTVQGRPYAIETSFTTWLELSLQAADPARKWDAINCGGVSYASYRLLPIMQEVLAYEPDLFIVYTGHNEFLEDRSYAAIKEAPAWQKAVHERLVNLRLYGAFRLVCRAGISSKEKSQPDELPPEAKLAADVEALLDYRGGLSVYHRDDDWQRDVISHFEANLRRMARLARAARVPLILVNPVSNLRDSPPFKCEPGPMDLETKQLLEEAWEEAKLVDWEKANEKLRLVQRVLEIDPRYADAHFLAGRCWEAMGELVKAKSAYIRAKDEDICPLRILEPMHKIIFDVTDQSDAILVDARELFEREEKLGLLSDQTLIDHVHPRIEGHQRIAEALFAEMQTQGIVTTRSGWETRREELYANRYKTLDSAYFPQSVARLEGLRIWTHGRATRTGLEKAIRRNAPSKGSSLLPRLE